MVHNRFPSLWHGLDGDSLEASHAEGLTVFEDKENIYVEAALPGIPEKQVKVFADESYISVQAERKYEVEKYQYHQKGAETYYYRIPLPNGVDRSVDPEYSLKNGMVVITLPKVKK